MRSVGNGTAAKIQVKGKGWRIKPPDEIYEAKDNKEKQKIRFHIAFDDDEADRALLMHVWSDWMSFWSTWSAVAHPDRRVWTQIPH